MDLKLTFRSNLGRCRDKSDVQELENAVKQAISEAFGDNRCFDLFPDAGVLGALRSGTPVDSLSARFTDLKNDIFTRVAGGNATIQNRLSNNAHLSSRITRAARLLHAALADLHNPRLDGRRFVFVSEKPDQPTLHHVSETETVVSHVGHGPVWKEIPSIYLSLRLLDTVRSENIEYEAALFEGFKAMLVTEERAIETGFSHVESPAPDQIDLVNLLIEELLRAVRTAVVPYEKVPVRKKPRRFTPKNRSTLIGLLDARLDWDEMAFDYEKNMKAIQNLQRLARYYKKNDDAGSLEEIVRLLVSASGHDMHEVRNQANILLERIFSPKEFDAPIASHFINLTQGVQETIAFDLPRSRHGYFLRLYRAAQGGPYTLQKNLDCRDVDLDFGELPGQYSVTVRIDEPGHFDYVVFRKQRRGAQWLSGTRLSGRINVIPDVRGEIIMEIFPDIHGHTRIYWGDKRYPGLVYNENGEVIRLGRFSDITAHLEDLQRRYLITAVYILGVQKRGTNREDWAPEATSPSPFSPVSLTEIEPSLGGGVEFKKLVARAHELGIRVIVDMVPHLNRKSAEVPEEHVVRCYDGGGNLVDRASTDGRYGSWNDGKLLNFRKFAVWKYIGDSIGELIERYDIDGIRFDSAHALPIMMKKNNYPFIYGEERERESMVEGTIIVNDREDEHFITTAYYDSACRDIIANPFHYYLALTIERKMREKKKGYFLNIAECYWGRERVLTRTGIIPYNSAMFKICEQVIHGTVDVREIYHLYDSYYPQALPRGTELLGILGNHDERRAVNTFGQRGIRAASMLTSFMSNIILDYEGSAEGEGWKVYLDNIYVNWNQFEYAADRSVSGFYRNLYSFHREHRGKGFLIWAGNTMVAAAAKFTDKLIVIGAFNFSQSTQTVMLQFDNSFLPIDDCGYYRLSDPMYSPVTGRYGYYTGQELRVSKIQTVVSYTDRVKVLHLFPVEEPEKYYREFLKESFIRVCFFSDVTHLTAHFAYLEVASHSQSFQTFTDFVRDRLLPLFDGDGSYTLEIGLKRAIFHLFRNGVQSGETLLKYIDRMEASGDRVFSELGRKLKAHNRKGSLVFISAEAEPFSKIGGLANVVYELPRELKLLGEEVYVITPFYRFGDQKSVEKMKKSVLKYKIAYSGVNVRFKILEQEYVVGVHGGEVDGIHYFLLDHHEFFDGLYWGYTAEEKLRRRIAFARACAEVITTFGLFPLFTFTNDAFAGVFNGIVKGDHVYRDNPNFARTSFIHILHNVGWQYFDAYYRWERGFDHFRLFNLPDYLAGNFLDPVHHERINCMAAGVRFADRVITVSPSYAAQIQIASDGLEHLLTEVKGINNAIGREFYNRTKTHFRSSGFVENQYPLFMEKVGEDAQLEMKLKERYPELLKGPRYCETAGDLYRRSILTRMRNKLLLQSQLRLSVDPDKLLFTMIHRIVEQKGFQLLLEASEGIFKHLGFQGIIGGPVPSGDQKGEELARGIVQLSRFYPESVSVSIGFVDVATALMSSDVFLMPSMYEPGGISQLEAFACGCLVVARATGGLRDTVRPLRVRGRTIEGNGFLFTDYTPESFYDAMARCSAFLQKSDERVIVRARRKAQQLVYYWDRSAREYIREVYTLKEIIRII